MEREGGDVCVCVREREREGMRVGWVGVRVNVCVRGVFVCESVQVKQSLKLFHQVARNIDPYVQHVVP